MAEEVVEERVGPVERMVPKRRCAGHLHSPRGNLECIREEHDPGEPCSGWLLVDFRPQEHAH